MTKSTRTAALSLLAAFLLGAVAGGGALALTHRPSSRGGRPEGPSGYLAGLTKTLKLSATQHDSVEAILKRYEPTMDSIWQDFRPKFETIRAQLRSDINAQLTPDQQRQYAEMLERRNAGRRNKDSSNAPR
ncbi:MAG TPA: periplasmic heavy metal sensor [Gemmatimonadales bacterium]|nr:periplasmic heavy metal sensor [Gemmatimonadales bacterium]